jgi:hypothetical protein
MARVVREAPIIVTIDAMPDPSVDDAPARHPHRKQPRDRGQLSLLAVAVLAFVALGLAGWALLRPAGGGGSSTEPTYTAAQRADAKGKVCATFDTVRTGVSQNTNLQAPGGADDIVGNLAVAANARLSLYDGGQYLLARLDPATPPDLANAVRSFGNTLMDIGASATAGERNTDPEQAARLRDADAVNRTIGGLCA